jgi:diaminohydroxyphosphoribosylaminopyrimidine deaminase/5-amino-6-(5-phosphoribosylamino)uracil reductase
MDRAIELARNGLGFVEPNPPVGAVIVDENLSLLGEGFHQRFGGSHAEIHALEQVGAKAAGATLVVTLEPCCHFGKTPPCTDALVAAGIRQVIVGTQDPAPHAAGRGLMKLREAGLVVEVGLREADAARLIAPFRKRVVTGLPYVHAKWAMTLDGKLAARTGASQWISNDASRRVVHQLRGRMDAIIVGANTARTDDPRLTARPAGPRTAARIVVGSAADLPLDSRLVRTADQVPVIVAACESAPAENVRRLRDAGVEVLQFPFSPGAADPARAVNLLELLKELGRREMTNVLVEGGGALLGSFFDQDLLDEVHIFIAPKLVGGAEALTPLAGIGLAEIAQAPQLDGPTIEVLDGDIYLHGPYRRDPPA